MLPARPLSQNISRRIIPAANTAADAAGAGSAAQGNPAAQAGAAEAGKEGEAQAGKPGGMDGSVTAFDVRQCVERQLRIKLHDSHVLMEAPITSFGRYEVSEEWREVGMVILMQRGHCVAAP